MKLNKNTIQFSRSFYLTEEELKNIEAQDKMDDVYASHASALGLDVAMGKKGIFTPWDLENVTDELETGSKVWKAELFVFTRDELNQLIGRVERGEVLFDEETKTDAS